MGYKIVRVECPNCAATNLVDVNGEDLWKCNYCGAFLKSDASKDGENELGTTDLVQLYLSLLGQGKEVEAYFVLEKIKLLLGRTPYFYYLLMFYELRGASEEEMLGDEFLLAKLDAILVEKKKSGIRTVSEEMLVAQIDKSFERNLLMAIRKASDEDEKKRYVEFRDKYIKKMVEMLKAHSEGKGVAERKNSVIKGLGIWLHNRSAGRARGKKD